LMTYNIHLLKRLQWIIDSHLASWTFCIIIFFEVICYT
jgi:hypothetical protein